MSANQRRIHTGSKIIQDYGRTHFGATVDRDDWHMVASDLIADVLHACTSVGLDPATVLTRALDGYYGDLEDD